VGYASEVLVLLTDEPSTESVRIPKDDFSVFRAEWTGLLGTGGTPVSTGLTGVVLGVYAIDAHRACHYQVVDVTVRTARQVLTV